MDCLADLVKEFGKEGLSEEDGRKILSKIKGALKSESVGGREAAFDQLQRFRAARAQGLREELLNSLKENRIRNLFKGQAKKNWAKVLDGLVSGSQYSIEGGRIIPGNLRARLLGDFSDMLTVLDKDAKLKKQFQTGELNREAMIALFERDNPGAKTSVSKGAQAIADLMGKVHDKVIDLYDRAGVHIERRSGYIMRQAHDAKKLVDAGFESWADQIGGHLDEAKTFEALADREGVTVSELTHEQKREFLRAAFDDITHGKSRLADEGAILDEVPSYLSGRVSKNAQKQVAAARKLHFKSGDAFFEYNQAFGKRNLYEAMVAEIDHSVKTLSLVETFGTNPSQMLRKIIDWGRGNLAGDELHTFEKKMRSVEAQFAVAQGVSNAPPENIVAKFIVGWKRLLDAALLGNASIRSITDLANAAAVMTDNNGKNYWGNLASVTGEFWSHFKAMPFLSDAGKETQNLWARRLGMSFQEIGGLFAHENAVGANEPGLTLKIHRLFHRYSLIGRFAEATKSAVAKLTANALADLSEQDWGGLAKETQTRLRQFGIGEEEWGIVRKGVEEFQDSTGGADRALTPEGVRKLDASFFRSNRQREDLANAVASFISDAAEVGSPTPDFRTQAIITGGRPPDDMVGLLRRIAFQFQSFPLQMTFNSGRRLNFNAEGLIPETYHARLANARYNAGTFANSMVAMTALAYVADAFVDISQGKEPKDPKDPKILKEMFLKGGAGAMYADYLLGDQANRHGEGLIPGAFGPMLGKFNNLAQIYTALQGSAGSAVQGEWGQAQDQLGKAAQKSAREILQLVPGRNLFYTKLALDHLILTDIAERINPGHTERMKDYAAKNAGLVHDQQQYFIPPEATLGAALGGR